MSGIDVWDRDQFEREDREDENVPDDVFASAPLTDFDPCGDER